MPNQPRFPISSHNTSFIETLLLPFAEGLLPNPEDGSAFFIRAELAPHLEAEWKSRLVCEQTLRSEYDPLAEAGFNTVTKLEGRFNFGLCHLTKHKKENYGNVARAWDHLNPGGWLVCVGANDTGVKSFEKNIRNEIAITGNLSKNHCRVFWMEKSADAGPCPSEWKSYSELGSHIEDTHYLTQPGMFCWEKVDKGSAFLAENFPRKIKGTIADFGSGWGYLSEQLLKQYPEVTEVDLYEDEFLALEASRKNLEPLGLPDKTNFLWTDLGGACPRPNHYNWIIMNPPFHRSARTDVSLGIKFIENAARALKRSGSLLLVANRQLPYEKALGEYFRSTERIAENPEYKILLASSPSTK